MQKNVSTEYSSVQITSTYVTGLLQRVQMLTSLHDGAVSTLSIGRARVLIYSRSFIYFETNTFISQTQKFQYLFSRYSTDI